MAFPMTTPQVPVYGMVSAHMHNNPSDTEQAGGNVRAGAVSVIDALGGLFT